MRPIARLESSQVELEKKQNWRLELRVSVVLASQSQSQRVGQRVIA